MVNALKKEKTWKQAAIERLSSQIDALILNEPGGLPFPYFRKPDQQ